MHQSRHVLIFESHSHPEQPPNHMAQPGHVQDGSEAPRWCLGPRSQCVRHDGLEGG